MRCRAGVASASAPEDDDAGTTDCDLGDGNAWEDKCKAGDDLDAWRIDGVTKLVKPACLTFSPAPTTGVVDEDVRESRPTRRNVTLFNIFGISLGFVSFSLPLFALVETFADTSTGSGGGSFFDRVAVRKPCSKLERRRWNDLEGASEVVEVELKTSGEDERCG